MPVLEPPPTCSVALVNMPFSLLSHPSLALGLLKAGLARRGISAHVYNLGIRFATTLGVPLYQRMAMAQPTDLTGEWVFSDALFGHDPAADLAYSAEVLDRFETDHSENGLLGLPAALARVRAAVEPFLDDCVSALPWERFRIVGFTSVFQQHVASLALARRLKARHPDLFIVLGGPNCEGPMGRATLHAFPFVDAICSGEGDEVFPALVEELLSGATPRERPGIRLQGARARRGHLPLADRSLADGSPAPSVHDLDALPFPNFDEYFAQMREAFPTVETRLLFETSRGCWWGEKQHCTFCGLNGSTMGFRHKSPTRALDELEWLLRSYGGSTRRVSATDNILPLRYFEDFLPALAERGHEIELFYETKANLREEQIALFCRAGLTSIQPGIESLSTPVLRLMRKGVTRLQNIQLLKWCRQYGIDVAWNWLLGVPGERPDHYAGLPELIGAIAHLEPPDGWGVVRIDRFSPYFTDPESFGIRNLRPYSAYRHVYRHLAADQLRDLAYYFQADFDALADSPTRAALVTALADWKDHAAEYALFSLAIDDRLHVVDFRPGAAEPQLTLTGLARAVHDVCARITGRKALFERVVERGYADATPEALAEAVEMLLARRLLIAEDERLLALAVPLGYAYTPAGSVRARFLASLPPAH